MNDYDTFVEYLRDHGISLAERLSIEAFALTAEHALHAVEIARANDLMIVGGDVYFERRGDVGPPEGLCAWTTDDGQRVGGSTLIYRDVERRASQARERILSFLPPPGERRWYSLTVIK